MNTLSKIPVRITSIHLALVLAVSLLASRPARADEFTDDLVQAAKALKTEAAQAPPTAPDEWPEAENINTASAAFMACFDLSINPCGNRQSCSR